MRSRKKLLKDCKLYVILDTQVNSYAEIFEIAENCVKAGVDIFQLRDKQGTAKNMVYASKQLVKIISSRAIFIVNDRVDVTLVSGADGVHCGQDDLSVAQARKILGSKAIVGVSCQSLNHVRNAIKEGADYLGFGSIFKTLTKPDRQPMDKKILEKVLKETRLPIFSIGGISLKNISYLIDSGVQRVAVCRDICLAKEIQRVVGEYRKLLS